MKHFYRRTFKGTESYQLPSHGSTYLLDLILIICTGIILFFDSCHIVFSKVFVGNLLSSGSLTCYVTTYQDRKKKSLVRFLEESMAGKFAFEIY